MSDKDYKGKKGADGDDYKPLEFYQKRASSVENGFETFAEGDEYYFTYNIDGQTVLISESYATEKGRDNGVASVDKNRLIEKRFKKDTYQSDKYFFNLVAGNHQEIATSAWFTSESAMNAAIDRLMGVSSAPLAAAAIFGAVAAAPLVDTSSSVAPMAAASIPVSKDQEPLAATPSSAAAIEEDEGGGLRWLWWLLPLLLLLLAWYLFSQCCSKPAESELAEVPSAAVVAPEIVAPEIAAPEIVVPEIKAPVIGSVGNLGDFAANALPGGEELNIPEFGVESKLLAFIKDDSRPVDKTTWFDFDRIGFDTAKADLTLDSREQIANIAQILRAYPSVNLKIGGYTDNTGSEAFNQTLSEARAETVKNSLITQGIDQRRITSEGYGPQFPIASNDTEEGRAQNRRISLRVTKK